MAKGKIKIGLNSVKEMSFKFHPEKISGEFDPSQLRIGFDNSLEAVDGGNDIITVDFGVKYFYKNEEILECIYGFSFVVENITKYIKMNADKSVKVEVIMPKLLTIALGTLRGVILAKTEGSPIAACPLPIVDIDEE